MKISVANILPNPPTQQTSSPGQSAPANSSDNTGFSQQLGMAKAKAAQGQGTGNNVQQPQTASANSTPDAKQTAANSTQDKGKPKQQQQATDQADAANEAETEAQVSTIAEQEAKLAEEAQNEPPLIRPKMPKVISPQLPAAAKGKGSKGDSPSTSSSTQNKPANADSNQTADAPANLTTLQAAASQQAVAANAKASSNDAPADHPEDPTAPRQVATKANVSPFKAQNAAPDAQKQTTGQSAADAAAGSGQDPGPLAPKEIMINGDPNPSPFAQMFAQTTGQAQQTPTMSFQHIVAPQQPQTPVAQFAETNQPAIVSTIHGSLLPDGGTMNINLNPPELGPMQISVTMQNGVMSASFQTSSDQATRLLTHTLGQLKNALEIQGVSVDRLHVSQTNSAENSSSSNSDSENNGKQSQQDGQSNAQQEEQRRETLRRMWRKLRGQEDPLDLVA